MTERCPLTCCRSGWRHGSRRWALQRRAPTSGESMAIPENHLTREEAHKLLESKESHFLEFKGCGIKPAKLTETISAFANADGGELYIGASEVNTGFEWAGFSNSESANGHLQAFENLFPLGQFFRYEFLTTEPDAGYLLFVEVLKNPKIVKASNGIAYLRRGAQNLPQTTAEQLRRLELNKGLSSFESETVQASVSEVADSDVIRDFLSQVVPAAQPQPWLRKQQLIYDDKPTVAGTVLFAEVPQAILPKRCAVKIYRYKTSERVGTRETLESQPATIEGHLYKQIEESVRETKRAIETSRTDLDDEPEVLRYPHETLHEIITNALLHRDYSIADDVHVRIFNNRVEVESPGLLAGHVTERNVYSERFARNGNLVRIINKFPNPPNKDIGEGLRTARDAMEIIRLKAPELKQQENSVIVYIRHESIASYESTIMNYLDEHGSIMSADVRRICHITQSKGWGIIRRLLDRNVLEKVPGSSSATVAYRKATSGTPSPTAREVNRQLGKEREKKVLEYLDRNGTISFPVLVGTFSLPVVTAHRLLKKLEAIGVVRRLPDRHNRAAIYGPTVRSEQASRKAISASVQ
jgi:ATP-dependent DNA helicase RecG